MEAKNNQNIIMEWGRTLGTQLLTTIYKSTVTDRSLKTIIMSYTRFHKQIFNFGQVEGKINSEHEVEFIYKDFEPNWQNFYSIATGWMERYIEFCVSQKVQYKVIKDPDDGTVHIKLSWSSTRPKSNPAAPVQKP
ncbi:MAG: hypothetical protein RBG13Loki_3178 [Promethearchaeota archaeon CR_4]|nr:MAG: hypothetical protein RBG13Loki_3178 [Candidatus Lokiarchaeota archaeon CR_4]